MRQTYATVGKASKTPKTTELHKNTFSKLACFVKVLSLQPSGKDKGAALKQTVTIYPDENAKKATNTTNTISSELGNQSGSEATMKKSGTSINLTNANMDIDIADVIDRSRAVGLANTSANNRVKNSTWGSIGESDFTWVKYDPKNV